MINLQTLLIIASCVAVVFLIGLILAIAVFTKKPKAAPVSSSSDQPESGAAKTTVYCCKACGCVVKKGTRVCPHCGAYIGPNKVRNARILAGVCAVLLCISLAGNFGLSLYVWELNNKVATVSASVDENESLLSQRELLRSELDSYKTKYSDALKEIEKLKENAIDDLLYHDQKEKSLTHYLDFYSNNLALVNSIDPFDKVYHTIWCHRLNETFYTCPIKVAENMSAQPCGDCHSSLGNTATIP